MSEPLWGLYRIFLAVLEEGSLSGAARTLGLTQPTIGRQIMALEQALNLSLFVRSQHGLSPTPTALQLRPYAEALAATAAALLRAASSQDAEARGAVRITASDVMGAEVLPSILGPLREIHQGLVIELVLSNRVENLLNREADIAVRMVRPNQDALIARYIGEVPLGLFASRNYLERHGEPRCLKELSKYAVIGYDRETAFLRSHKEMLGDVDRDLFALRTDSDLAQLAALRAGFGVGVCQIGLAERDPSLVRLLADQFEIKLDTWIAMHEDLKEIRRCRVVFDALAEGLSRYVKQ